MVKVGDEVDRECTYCKILRGHVVAAVEGGMARSWVCKYCNKVTRARKKKGEPSRPIQRGVTRAPVPDIAPDPDNARRYAPSLAFAAGETVDHPRFGLGVVELVQHDGKIHVRFGGERKVLVAGRA